MMMAVVSTLVKLTHILCSSNYTTSEQKHKKNRYGSRHGLIALAIERGVATPSTPTPGSSPDSICNENIKMGVVIGVVVGHPLIRSTLLIENLGSATVCYTFKFAYQFFRHFC